MHWEKAVKQGYLNVSPSFLKNYYECETSGILKTTESSWSNVHTQYGHAYGTAGAELVRNQHLPRQSSRITSGLLKALPYIKDFWEVKSPIHGKNLQKLLSGLIETDIWVQKREMAFHSEEVKIIVQIVNSHGEIIGWLSGTYDVCVIDKQGNKLIHDFKAVTSLSYYSFKTDMQIPFYTILNILRDMQEGNQLKWSAQSMYIAHTTKNPAPLAVTKLSLGSVSNIIEPHMYKAIEAAKKIYKSANKDVVNRLNEFSINPHVCSRDSFQCEYEDHCARYPRDHKNFETSIIDDRNPTDIVRITATVEDIMEATLIYKQLAIAEYQSQKSSTVTLDSTETIACMSDLLEDDFGLEL